MASMNFPTYSRLDGLNSLVTKCVHTLCVPASDAATLPKTQSSVPSLYDFNLLTNHSTKKRGSSRELPCRLLELYLERFHAKRNTNAITGSSSRRSLLDMHSRQSVLDYIIRERILVRANFVLQLLRDGGAFHFDLWALCEINEFSPAEVEAILQAMAAVAGAFRSLSIGGTSWIYEFTLERGPLRKLLNQAALGTSLRSLKMQQVSFESLFALMHSCGRLQRLEIAQPSLQCADIEKIASYLRMQQQHLPSSVKDRGLMHLLPFFPRLTTLRCTPFEELLDTLEQSLAHRHHLQLPTTVTAARRTVAVLADLRSLSIAHPMSVDTVDRLMAACPHLVELSIQVQEGMSLAALATEQTAATLRRLALNNSPSMPLNFVEHVAPLLRSPTGRRLTSLSLEYFDHIDLTTVTESCPSLRSFSAQWFSTVTVQQLADEHSRRLHRMMASIKKCSSAASSCKPFSELRHLRLRPRPHQSLSAEVVAYLLNDAADLRHIELYCCSELTDEAILAINQRNPLPHLQTFILRHGHSVTNGALCRLVASAAASTGSLVFHDCGLVPPVRKEEM
ncbi:hypothetical protein TYRP_009314 [Tyrophagus putrescentiae]|nr:hypothetical protein TYRP_009314 [Tyrophagus putrescentiae]